jgi:hypothetical protein
LPLFFVAAGFYLVALAPAFELWQGPPVSVLLMTRTAAGRQLRAQTRRARRIAAALLAALIALRQSAQCRWTGDLRSMT